LKEVGIIPAIRRPFTRPNNPLLKMELVASRPKKAHSKANQGQSSLCSTQPRGFKLYLRMLRARPSYYRLIHHKQPHAANAMEFAYLHQFRGDRLGGA
jgi:hypothetical protein